LLRDAAGTVPSGIAVQNGNYQHEDPKTGRRITVPELFQFAAENLKLDYIFWSAQEPFYSKEVIPFLKDQAKMSRNVRREPRLP